RLVAIHHSPVPPLAMSLCLRVSASPCLTLHVSFSRNGADRLFSMLTIKRVAPGSVAEQIGLRSGDALVSIDGHHVGDVIDVHFYASADTVEVTWQTPQGERGEAGVEVGPDGMGLEFTQPTEDGIRICNNRCVLC